VCAIEIIVRRTKNLRNLALAEKMSKSNGEPIDKLLLCPWSVCLVALSNDQSIGIGKSSATLFLFYSNDLW
jgi:hypothetical protein